MVGGQSKMAHLHGIKMPSVNQWIRKDKEVPAARCKKTAQFTGWKVTPHMLRPDLYPNPWDGLPEDRARRMLCACDPVEEEAA